MIKKIYDRDTGNIYDVGADSKLKLVAEGSYDILSDSTVKNYKLNNRLEPNKCYLIEMHCYGYGGMTSAVFKTFGVPYEDRVSVYGNTAGCWWNVNDEIVNICFSYQCYLDEIGILTILGKDSSGELYGEEDDELRIYELPFSM
jgi:hypothetical protein